MSDLSEALSLDPAAAAAMAEEAAYDADYYLANIDEDEACDWASRVAQEAEVPMCVLFVPEASGRSGEYRCGPVDEMDVLANGSEDWEVVEAFDEDGEPSEITDDMFEDDDVDLTDEDIATLDAEDRAVEERVRRLPAAARRKRARSRRKRKPINAKRRARQRKAKLWRRRNKGKIRRYNRRYLRRESADEMDEALIARRQRLTRLGAKRKALTTMSAKRRDTASRAKRWRLNNKSKARRYGQLYRRPHSKVEAMELISQATAARLGGGSVASVVEHMLAGTVLDEARKAADLRRVFARLSRTEGWRRDGWDRARILREIDPNFVHHAEHFDRLLHGGHHRNGQEYAGGGGLSWGGLVVNEHEALLRVRGSFEYKARQEVYQQTIRFANYRRVAETAELSWPEKALVLLTMDTLRVHCDCDAYRFYHQNAATKKGFALVPETRDAPLNNPADKSGACKHLNVVLKWIGAQSSRMATEMKQHHKGAE